MGNEDEERKAIGGKGECIRVRVGLEAHTRVLA